MDDSTVQIRRAVPADKRAIRACVDDAYRPYLDRMKTAPAPMLDDYGLLIERWAVHVARRRGQLVGLIVMWTEVDHVFIDNVAVVPDAQGSGVAKRLLEYADEFARLEDRTELRLYTNEAMTENLDYYPRRGFVETHRHVESGYHRVYFARSVPSLA